MFTVYDEMDAPSTTGTSLKGYINATYDQLVGQLGEPTFNEPSGDEKVQVEWVIKYGGEVFTIYDWKTYDRMITKKSFDRFHIGGTTSALDLVNELEDMIND